MISSRSMFRRAIVVLERHSARYFSEKKILHPTRLNLTADNQHLQVNVFDEKNQQLLGRMTLSEANRLATIRQLLVVLMDPSSNPLDVRLMTGRRLAELREEIRPNKVEEKFSEVTIRLRSHIADHDLETKMVHARAAHSREETVRLVIDFGEQIDEKDTEAMKIRRDEQKEFLQRLQRYLNDFPTVHTNSKSTHSIILIIPSPSTIEKSARKHHEH